jgi:hypothetical protein
MNDTLRSFLCAFLTDCVDHGNGTMEIFYEDADVMYISTHQV